MVSDLPRVCDPVLGRHWIEKSLRNKVFRSNEYARSGPSMSKDDLAGGTKRPRKLRGPLHAPGNNRTGELRESTKASGAENAARRRAEAESRLLISLTKAILAAADFESALKTALESICAFTRWDYGEYWLPNPERNALVMRSCWHQNREQLAQLENATRAMSVQPELNHGLPGRVWVSQRPEWIPDLSSVSGLLRQSLFEQAGLKSAVVIPVVSGNQVQAVLVFLTRKAREADDSLMQIVGGAAAQLGFVFYHKQTEEQLFKNEALLQSIIDSSTRVIYLKDKEGRYITINCQFELLFRIDERDARGKTDFDIFPPEYAEVFRGNDRKVIETGLPMEFEEVALLDDGPHTYLSNKFPMFDSAGGLYAICGISTDITEQKRLQEMYQSARDVLWDEVEKRTAKLVETNQALLLVNKQKETALEALQRSDRLLRTIIEAEPECVKIFGRDGVLSLMNPAGLKMIEADSTEEIQGRNVYPLVVAEDRAAFQSLTEAIFRGESGRLEFDIIGLKGTRRTLETHAVPLRDSLGNITSALAVTREITERKRARESIRRSEGWLRALIETTQDAVVSIDRKGQIQLFNPAAERMFGYKREEIVNCQVSLLMAEPYGSEHDGYVARYEKTREPRAIGRIRTVQAKRKNGESFPIELSVTEIPSDDEIHYAAFIRDISEKVKLQSQAIESERLATIGTMAAKFGHELGNPLNGMSLTVQLLEHKLVGQTGTTDSQVISTVDRLKREVARLNSLLEEFRALSRREKFNFRRANVRRIVNEALEMEMPRLQQLGIMVELDFADDLPLISVDADKIKQVILNLTKNAADAMDGGGTLVVRTSVSADEIVFEVSDTGIGISPEVDIFEPFFTTKPSGTGIGLTIIKQIVQAHGGTITYRSEPGKGTSFTVALPVA